MEALSSEESRGEVQKMMFQLEARQSEEGRLMVQTLTIPLEALLSEESSRTVIVCSWLSFLGKTRARG